jgi:hypothetical protein
MVLKTKRISAAESRGEAGRVHSFASDGRLRWSVEQRLAFIEERLFWLGVVNRTDLVRRFGVSMSQASGDINRYLAFDPADVTYDKSAKRYAAGEEFKPVVATPDASRYLGELRLVDLGVISPVETVLGTVPAFAATPVPERRIDPFVLRTVLRGIRERRSLDATYQSMSRPEPTRRLIDPHALAFDGFRWHARAFDQQTGAFRDFVLGRLSRPKPGEPARSAASDDHDWLTFVDLVIAPHPGLTPAQASAIAIDYGIRDCSTSIRVRKALLFYALRRLGLDIPLGARRAVEQHIVLVNRAEVDAARLGPGES